MNLVYIDNNYMQYLQHHDNRVPTDLATGHKSRWYRPFVGPVMCLNGIEYYAPLSSGAPKFDTDFELRSITGSVLGCVRLKYMFPVPIGYTYPVALESIYATDKAYYTLLLQELDQISAGKNTLQRLARLSMQKQYANKTYPNFVKLEKKCKEFEKL